MFTINRESLAVELAIIQAAVEKKGTIPVLAFCLFEVVGNETKITATDLDVTITTSIENSESDGDWSFCVPARQLYNLVALFDGETVMFSEDPKNKWTKIQCGKSKHSLPSLANSEFPSPEKENPETVAVDAEILAQMLKAINPAMESRMDGEDKYKAVSFELREGKLDLTTSDSTELANATIAIPDQSLTFSALLPRRAGSALVSFLGNGKVQIGFSEKQAKFTSGNRKMFARLSMSKFPDWKKIIPSGDGHKLIIHNEELKSATKRVMVTVEDFSLVRVIKFNLSKNEIALESRGGDKGFSAETVPVECKSLNGDTLLIGVNGLQLLDFLNVSKENPTLEVWGVMKPLRFTIPNLPFNYQYITQPTRYE